MGDIQNLIDKSLTESENFVSSINCIRLNDTNVNLPRGNSIRFYHSKITGIFKNVETYKGRGDIFNKREQTEFIDDNNKYYNAIVTEYSLFNKFHVKGSEIIAVSTTFQEIELDGCNAKIIGNPYYGDIIEDYHGAIKDTYINVTNGKLIIKHMIIKNLDVLLKDCENAVIEFINCDFDAIKEFGNVTNCEIYFAQCRGVSFLRKGLVMTKSKITINNQEIKSRNDVIFSGTESEIIINNSPNIYSSVGIVNGNGTDISIYNSKIDGNPQCAFELSNKSNLKISKIFDDINSEVFLKSNDSAIDINNIQSIYSESSCFSVKNSFVKLNGFNIIESQDEIINSNQSTINYFDGNTIKGISLTSNNDNSILFKSINTIEIETSSYTNSNVKFIDITDLDSIINYSNSNILKLNVDTIDKDITTNNSNLSIYNNRILKNVTASNKSIFKILTFNEMGNFTSNDSVAIIKKGTKTGNINLNGSKIKIANLNEIGSINANNDSYLEVKYISNVDDINVSDGRFLNLYDLAITSGLNFDGFTCISKDIKMGSLNIAAKKADLLKIYCKGTMEISGASNVDMADIRTNGLNIANSSNVMGKTVNSGSLNISGGSVNINISGLNGCGTISVSSSHDVSISPVTATNITISNSKCNLINY